MLTVKDASDQRRREVDTPKKIKPRLILKACRKYLHLLWIGNYVRYFSDIFLGYTQCPRYLSNELAVDKASPSQHILSPCILSDPVKPRLEVTLVSTKFLDG
jgi:hypothetical protein